MKKTFLKRKRISGDFLLPVTVMAGVFLLFVLFLLRNDYVVPAGRARLPVASAKNLTKDSLKLEIKQNLILIDDKPVVFLNNFEFLPGQDPQTGYSGAVYKVLVEQRRKWPVPNVDPHLLVMADEETPYSTLKKVLASAANSGFVDLQLVVVANR